VGVSKETDKRTVLYVGPGRQDGAVARHLQTAGWQLDPVPDLSAARERMGAHNYCVGLALLKDLDVSGWSEMEEFFSSCGRCGRMQWIALAEPGLLTHRSFRELIYEHFYDFHTLPFDPRRLLSTLGHACGMAALGIGFAGAGVSVPGEYNMVGTSPAMRQVFRTIRRMAAVDAPVLISGESGTGKELMARAIHDQSARADRPFMAVNCGALPTHLVQSELFGHEKGAFTGAHQRTIGRIEAASRGTVFLDEVGDLPLELQANLLRFLQDRTIERVGSAQSITVDVRVIAATHVDLEAAVQAAQFREDLYYRLNVLRLHSPPLRERPDDAELLAAAVFEQYAHEKRGTVTGFRKSALVAMHEHDWPGNVRELINRVRQALILCEHRLISARDLGLERRKEPRRSGLTLAEARAAADKAAIQASLHRAKYNVAKAARQLGISRVYLYRLMKEYRIAQAPNESRDREPECSITESQSAL
jgi:DNA-binding NtrC family response regulator